MARIVIFGGQGYLGHNIIERLAKDHQFMTLGRTAEKHFEHLDYDHFSVSDSQLGEKLKRFEPEYFVISYYGNPSSKDITSYCDLNKMIIRIYHLLPGKPKIIFFSTQLVYGKSQSFWKKENSNVDPCDFYGIRCFAFENELERFAAGNHLILRIPIVYGGSLPSDTGYKNIISAFVNAASTGEVLNIFGSGNQVRSLIHIDDLVALLAQIFASGYSSKILNMCFNEYYSIRELANIITSKFNAIYNVNRAWPDSLDTPDLYDIRLESSKAMNMITNKWDLTKYLTSNYG